MDFQNIISSLGKAINAPVIFDWNTAAARNDYKDGNGKRGNSSAAGAAVNSALKTGGVPMPVANAPAYIKNLGQGGGATANAGLSSGGSNVASGYDAYGNYVAGGGGGAASQTARERAAAAGQWQQQMDYLYRQLGNLDGSFNSGMNQLGDNFNKGMSRLNEQQSNALTRYGLQRTDTARDFDSSSNDIDNNARNNYQALTSLLGRAGAGSSSASQVLTPYAVSNDASKTRGKVSETYGRNLRDLGLAEDETKQSYENNKRDLEDQKRSSEYGLKQGIESQRAQLQGKLAEAQGNLAQANGGDFNAAKNAMGGALSSRDAIERSLSTLLDQYRNPYTVKDVAAKNVATQNYALDANGVKVEGGNGQGADTDTAAEYAAKLKDEEARKKQAALA